MNDSNSLLSADAHPHAGLHLRLISQAPVALNVTFDCAPGELIALVGASGSGKTTVLRSLAGLHTPTDLQGHIRVGGQDWLHTARGICLKPQSRRVGLVFQHYALFPHLNAIDNIALCADFMPASGQFGNKKQALAWLERMGLAELAQRPVQQLSGGQQQRVALARALVRVQGVAPESAAGGVLLLDEPFSAVDAPMRQVLYRELAQLRASLKIPMVLVTHDLNEARRLAHRIVIIDSGASLQAASPAHIMSSPRNARVAHLVGIHNHFRGQFYPQTDRWAQLQWGLDSQAPRLIVRDKAKISAGSAVTWVLAAEAVRLLGDAEAAPAQTNVLCATFTELLPLGEISLCRLHIQGTSDTMELNLATSQVVAMRWHSGSAVRVALAFDAVHIMPLR